MTQNDIIQMAREAGIHVYPEFGGAFKRFYALAVAAEREACAKILDDEAKRRHLPGRGIVDQHFGNLLVLRAAAIRARGNS